MGDRCLACWRYGTRAIEMLAVSHATRGRRAWEIGNVGNGAVLEIWKHSVPPSLRPSLPPSIPPPSLPPSPSPLVPLSLSQQSAALDGRLAGLFCETNHYSIFNCCSKSLIAVFYLLSRYKPLLPAISKSGRPARRAASVRVCPTGGPCCVYVC